MTNELPDVFSGDAVVTPERAKRYFGEFKLDGYWGVLVKGHAGPQRNIEDYPDLKRHISYDYVFAEIDGRFSNQRVVVEWDPEWRLIRDSLVELWGIGNMQGNTQEAHDNRTRFGQLLRQFTGQGKYIAYEPRPTGETYPDKNTGVLKEKTSMWVVAVYDDTEACRVEHDIYWDISGSHNGQVNEPPTGLPLATGKIDRSLVIGLIESYINGSAIGEDGHVDMVKVQKFINDNESVAGDVTVEDDDMKAMVARIEAQNDPVPF